MLGLSFLLGGRKIWLQLILLVFLYSHLIWRLMKAPIQQSNKRHASLQMGLALSFQWLQTHGETHADSTCWSTSGGNLPNSACSDTLRRASGCAGSQGQKWDLATADCAGGWTFGFWTKFVVTTSPSCCKRRTVCARCQVLNSLVAFLTRMCGYCDHIQHITVLPPSSKYTRGRIWIQSCKLEKQTGKKKNNKTQGWSFVKTSAKHYPWTGIINFMSTNWDRIARKCWRKGSGDYSGL